MKALNKLIKIVSSILIACFISFTIISCANNVDDNQPEQTNYSLISFSAEQSATTSNAVALTWIDSVKAAKYYIYYNTTNDSSAATKYSSNGYVSDEYDSSYEKTGNYKGTKDIALAESGTYYFWVKAVDSSNNESEFSNSVSCVFVYSSLASPTDIQTTQSETSYNNVTVTWRDSKKASKYYIYYNTTNDSATATKYSSYGYASVEYDSSYNETGYYKGSKDIALAESGTYYFWVKSVDGTSNESEFSECATAIFTYSALNAPIDVSAEASTSKSVKITWRDSKKASKYYIYYKTTNDSATATKYSSYGYSSVEYDSNYNETGYYKGSKDIDIPTGVYYFWVKSVDGTDHESPFSTEATYTVN